MNLEDVCGECFDIVLVESVWCEQSLCTWCTLLRDRGSGRVVSAKTGDDSRGGFVASENGPPLKTVLRVDLGRV